ncbi:MAG: PaaI family thioesterase [Novosphingobium sp.]|nr:PaaI family thioesterase [Novosphingobium sp.]
MTELLDLGRSILAQQPFSRILGTEMTAYSMDGVELRLSISDMLRQQHGFVHGGVLAYLADNALTFAGGVAMGGGVLTSEMKLNYIRPAVGEQLVARAKSIAAGRTQGVARCEVYVIRNGAEWLCLAAQGTVAKAAGIPVERKPCAAVDDQSTAVA